MDNPHNNPCCYFLQTPCQIKKRGKSEMSIDERIELDISYARKASLLYDFWIMAKTPAAIFQKNDV